MSHGMITRGGVTYWILGSDDMVGGYKGRTRGQRQRRDGTASTTGVSISATCELAAFLGTGRSRAARVCRVCASRAIGCVPVTSRPTRLRIIPASRSPSARRFLFFFLFLLRFPPNLPQSDFFSLSLASGFAELLPRPASSKLVLHRIFASFLPASAFQSLCSPRPCCIGRRIPLHSLRRRRSTNHPPMGRDKKGRVDAHSKNTRSLTDFRRISLA